MIFFVFIAVLVGARFPSPDRVLVDGHGLPHPPRHGRHLLLALEKCKEVKIEE